MAQRKKKKKTIVWRVRGAPRPLVLDPDNFDPDDFDSEASRIESILDYLREVDTRPAARKPAKKKPAKKKPAKKKPVKKKRRKKRALTPIPLKNLPEFLVSGMEGIIGQFMFEELNRFNREQMASLLYHLVAAGYWRYRFWYDMKQFSEHYPQKLGSTFPVDSYTVADSPPFGAGSDTPIYQAVLDFVDGKRGKPHNLQGKVLYFWASDRRR